MNNNILENEKIIELELKKLNVGTKNIFHLLMTLLTGGIWGIIWLFCIFRNNSKVRYYDKLILQEKRKLIKEKNEKERG